MIRRALVPLFFCAGCLAPRSAETPRSGSVVDAVAAGAVEAHELAATTPDRKVYGWRLELVGDRARYFQCTAADTCTFRAADIPADSLHATKVVQRVRPTRDDGTSAAEVDVYELTLTRDVSTSRGGVSSDPRGLVVR